MNIIKCKLCREPFNSYGSQVCPVCLEQLDKDFVIVRDYICDHPDHANVEQIAEGTGVKEKHIVFLLQEGRLAVKGEISGVNLNTGLKCQVCGRSINSGTLCDSCTKALTRELGSASSALGSKKSDGADATRTSKYQVDHSKMR